MANNLKLRKSTSPKPTSITILIVLLLIQAVGTLGYGIYLGYSNGWIIFKGARFLNFLPFAMAEHATSGVVLISISVFMFIVVISFIKQKPWAWLAAMTIQGLSLLVGLIEYLIDNPNYVALAFGVVLVFYLNMQEVRDTFSPKHTLTS